MRVQLKYVIKCNFLSLHLYGDNVTNFQAISILEEEIWSH
jgi:hypothetical protein